MKKQTRFSYNPVKVCISLLIALALILCLASLVLANESFGDETFGKQSQSIINALQVQAKQRVQIGTSCQVDADSMQTLTDSQEGSTLAVKGVMPNSLPSTFDLRSCDLDGTGQKHNYVTSVKFQAPFGTCWSFATLAASETSILAQARQDAVSVDEQGNKHDTLDLSEHHLAWFNYTPLTSADSATQAGEGAVSMAEQKETGEYKQAKRMDAGGVGLQATTAFAAGSGPVVEPNSSSAMTAFEKQLLYRGKAAKTMQTKAGDTVYSDQDDWSVDNSLRYHQNYALEGSTILPDAATFDESGTYDIGHAQQVTSYMKQAIMSGRALNISFFADTYRPNMTDRAPRFINTDTWAHYVYDSPRTTNHLVTVVGWDDNYSKENFLTKAQEYKDGKPVYNPDGTPKMIDVPQPPADGAWIVKNSWGAVDSWGQGLNKSNWGVDGSGYFYISYYDKSLSDEQYYSFTQQDSNVDDALIANQYDYMPCEKTRAISQNSKVTTANVFTADKTQEIVELSCVTSTTDEEVTYDFYKLPDPEQGIAAGELVCSFDKHYDFAGFHREQMPTPIYIGKGDAFAVAITQRNENGYLLGISCDYNLDGYDAGLCNDQYYVNGVVNRGESMLFTASDGRWTDFADMKYELEHSSGETKYFSYDNFPIKAYGSSVAEKRDIAAANIVLDKQSYVYDGNPHAPNIYVSMDDTVLTQDSDYKLSGDLVKTDPGEYAINVEGISAFTGSVQVHWNIIAQNASTESGTNADVVETGDDMLGIFLFLAALAVLAACTGLLTVYLRSRRR